MTASLQGADDGAGFGVKGESAQNGDGVLGTTNGVRKAGVHGIHTGSGMRICYAVMGELARGTAAVKGEAGGPSGAGGEDQFSNSGVWGDSTLGPGVSGSSSAAEGVVGVGTIGVSGSSSAAEGVLGAGTIGVHGSGARIGVLGVTDSGEAAVRGEHKAAGFAGFFEGKVGVTHDLNVNGNITTLGDVRLSGADLAEEFTVCGEIEAEPGCVMVLAGDDQVQVSREAYDRRVAGVVSGAGSYRPGLILDRRADPTRRPLALTGKVWCRVDAQWGRVEIGDLLTTSPTPGHAMRADDPARAFGSVIGKALRPLTTGRGLIPVLIALQ